MRDGRREKDRSDRDRVGKRTKVRGWKMGWNSGRWLGGGAFLGLVSRPGRWWMRLRVSFRVGSISWFHTVRRPRQMPSSQTKQAEL
jgi:hypothetical protein